MDGASPFLNWSARRRRSSFPTMTKIARCWLLLLVIGSTPASAETVLPTYNSQGYCAGLAARTGAGSQAEIDSCMATEARKHAGISDLWGRVPEAIRTRCLRGRGDRQSYDLLSLCVETEMERLH
jgi:hypothetical protein